MTVSLQAPAGSHFEMEEVKSKGGDLALGEVPILIWEGLDAAKTYYGEEGILAMLDGTSPRVSYQGIARRLKIQGKTDDEIAKAQLEFKPGKRVVGQSTPVSRAAKSAKAAAEKVDGDTLAAFLDRVANGEISTEDLAALTA